MELSNPTRIDLAWLIIRPQNSLRVFSHFDVVPVIADWVGGNPSQLQRVSLSPVRAGFTTADEGQSGDLRINLTRLVRSWVIGSRPNFGLLVTPAFSGTAELQIFITGREP